MNANIEIPTEDGELVCVICYDKIGTINDTGEREQPVQLDCQHVFGNICLDFWLSKKRRCPICRTQVGGHGGSSDESDFSGSEGSDSSGSEEEEGDSDDNEDMDEDFDGESDSGDDVADSGDDESQVSELSDLSDHTQMSLDTEDGGDDIDIEVGMAGVGDEAEISTTSGEPAARTSAQQLRQGLLDRLSSLTSSTAATGNTMRFLVSAGMNLASVAGRSRTAQDDSMEEDLWTDES
jgi:hypothetical protein